MTAPPGVPACRDEDPAIFESTEPADHEMARVICAKCPVVAWCADERERAAIKAAAGCRPTGTWAGELWTKDGRAPTREHGTDRGYQQHRYRGEDVCNPCQRAHRKSNSDRERRRRLVREAETLALEAVKVSA